MIHKTIQRLHQILPKNVPILVVDDGSTDSTVSILEKCEVRIVRHIKNLGRAQARQSALSNAQADVLVFIDDDCVVDDDWFINLKKSWDVHGKSAVAIGGPTRFHDPLSFWGEYYEYMNPFHWNASLEKSEAPFFTHRLTTNSTSYKLSKLKEASIGFNTKIPRHLGGEDVVISDEILKNYGRQSLLFDPSVVAKLSGNVTFREVRKRWIQNAKTEIPIKYSFAPIKVQDRIKVIVLLIFGTTAVIGLPLLLDFKELASIALMGYLFLLLSRRKFILKSIWPAIGRNDKTHKGWRLNFQNFKLFIQLFAISNLALIFSVYGKIKTHIEMLDKPSDFILIERYNRRI
jgi:glycosyltransferase involved in cell wall biosynthesis